MSDIFELKRLCSNPDGTFGSLIKSSRIFCMTLEPQEPKLPAGIYLCELYKADSRNYLVYKINFPQADGRPILFHTGNSIVDTEGCILIGSFDPTYRHNGKTGVSNSKASFDLLMETKLPSFWLKVVDVNG